MTISPTHWWSLTILSPFLICGPFPYSEFETGMKSRTQNMSVMHNFTLNSTTNTSCEYQNKILLDSNQLPSGNINCIATMCKSKGGTGVHGSQNCRAVLHMESFLASILPPLFWSFAQLQWRVGSSIACYGLSHPNPVIARHTDLPGGAEHARQSGFYTSTL